MKDRTRRGLKQSASIFLLVATLSLGSVPEEAAEIPGAFLMDAVALPAAPLYYVAGRLAEIGGFALSSGPSRRQLENEIKRLQADLIRRDIDLARARQALGSYEEFRAVSRRTPFFVWSGDLLGSVQGGDTDVFSRSYIVSVGSRDGVQVGYPVVWGNIALGRVSMVGALYSRVRILADPKSRVTVRLGAGRYEGVLAGNGRRSCPVLFVPNADIKVGDVVVTSGTDEFFPPDLVVGRVSRFNPRPSEPQADVEVELELDFSRVENCLVLKRDDSGARDVAPAAGAG
jgi:rod shape-determining protein MreC